MSNSSVVMATKKKAKDTDERELESLVFGRGSELPTRLQRRVSVDADVSDSETGDLVRLDRRGDVGAEADAEVQVDDGDEPAPAEATRQPAWTDDDEHVTVGEVAATFAGGHGGRVPGGDTRYRAVLERRFAAVVGAPDWAQLDRKRRRDSDEQDADQLLTRTGRLLAADGRGRLAKGTLLVKRCGDLSGAVPTRPRTVTALEFHPRSQVALVGGGGRPSLALVQVDGQQNALVQEVPLAAGFRVSCAHFSADGRRVVAGSERAGHLLCYDMLAGRTTRIEAGRRLGLRSVARLVVSPDGRWLAVPAPRAGAIHLLSAESGEWVQTLQASGRVTALAFSRDATRLFTHSDEGHVYEWDMAARQCVHRFVDQGCLAGTSLALAPDGRMLACGSASGVVNVYETAAARRLEHPPPVKVLDHLTTGCDQLLFNATSELLAMASAQKEHAVKLVHVPSMSVFSNFPGWSQAVHEPHQLDFSRNSGFLAIGNNKFRALLYRLQHYDSY